MMSIRSRVVVAAAALTLVAAGCGSDDSSGSTSAPPAATAATATTAASTGAGPYGETPTAASSVDVATTSLGDVLTSGGRTLYVFTPDEGAAAPTCVDQCAQAWPALPGGAAAGAGVDEDDLTTVTRADGSSQVAYYGWPLYFYAGDAAPGDVNGQGVGGMWFVIGADGRPIGT